MSKISVITATIPSGASVSSAVSLIGSLDDDGARVPVSYRLTGLIMPASWTDAVLTFQVGFSEETEQDFYDNEGIEVTASVKAGCSFYLPPEMFASVTSVIIRSGSSSSAVAQGADREIGLVLREV